MAQTAAIFQVDGLLIFAAHAQKALGLQARMRHTRPGTAFGGQALKDQGRRLARAALLLSCLALLRKPANVLRKNMSLRALPINDSRLGTSCSVGALQKYKTALESPYAPDYNSKCLLQMNEDIRRFVAAIHLQSAGAKLTLRSQPSIFTICPASPVFFFPQIPFFMLHFAGGACGTELGTQSWGEGEVCLSKCRYNLE